VYNATAAAGRVKKSYKKKTMIRDIKKSYKKKTMIRDNYSGCIGWTSKIYLQDITR